MPPHPTTKGPNIPRGGQFDNGFFFHADATFYQSEALDNTFSIASTLGQKGCLCFHATASSIEVKGVMETETQFQGQRGIHSKRLPKAINCWPLLELGPFDSLLVFAISLAPVQTGPKYVATYPG